MTRHVLLSNSAGESFLAPIQQVINGVACSAAAHAAELLNSCDVRPLVVVFVLEPEGKGIAMAESGAVGAPFAASDWQRFKEAVAAIPNGGPLATPEPCPAEYVADGKRYGCSKLLGHSGKCDMVLDEPKS